MHPPFMKYIYPTVGKFVICCAAILILGYKPSAAAVTDSTYVRNSATKGSFSLSANGFSAPIFTSKTDFAGVLRAAGDLQNDIGAVTGVKPDASTGAPRGKNILLIGTIGKSQVIDGLIKSKKLNVAGILGKWESFVLQVVDKPLPGVDKALVIAGSDKRGTIYGIYDLSEKMGVSPWYWWADVPVAHHAALYITAGKFTNGEPAVKYRGIFINDEAPAFSGWAKQKFGGINHLVYAKMFELILRLKGNYLWPAMWGSAFNDDDTLNRKTADDYGIVMGTSHHEPMDRAQTEWKRYGSGEWNYEKNGEVLRSFWRKGIENMGDAETLVTVGMRGDGDMAMQQGTNIVLLEKIVADQRDIIASVTKKPARKTPQVWALYKEVQDYYDKGMQVPNDVTLLLCDDNWGNIRKLPALDAPLREGGYGIYYHFDYVGGPRNYKWINTNPITKVWEQMHLAYQHKVDRVWIVNVGDLKPMEFPISFFLDYAWNPDKIGPRDLLAFTRKWATAQFGNLHAGEIADILSAYSKYNGRCKPELLNENTYSLVNYNEFEGVVNDYKRLNKQADSLYRLMPPEFKDAYYQLVLHPVEASANLYAMYYATALNHLYAAQGRSATNQMAAEVKTLFDRDAQISDYYNNRLAGGKWSHMMDQTHIGYTYWQQPSVNAMPKVSLIDVPQIGSMGVAVEGSADSWPRAGNSGAPSLPQFNDRINQSHFFELFNKGLSPVYYTIITDKFVRLSSYKGAIDKQTRISVNIDWQSVPAGTNQSVISITASDGIRVDVDLKLQRISLPLPKGFLQMDSYVSIEAAHYQKAIPGSSYAWAEIPDYGRTLSAMTVLPLKKASGKTPLNAKPCLEYIVTLRDTGMIELNAYLAPTIDFTVDKSLKYAVAIDDEQPHVQSFDADKNPRLWSQAVSNSINIVTTKHRVSKSGTHVIKFWMDSPAIVLEKLVLQNAGAVKHSYLGPPESLHN